MKKIFLGRRKSEFCIVDDADFVELSKKSWSLSGGYVVRKQKIGGKLVSIIMHREIVEATGDVEVDHINGNRLDNRKCNLRAVSTAENQMNRGKPRNNTSGFKGVTFHKKTNKWQAAIGYGGGVHYLGLFPEPSEAAQAYNKAAIAFHGPFARINRP